MVPLFLNWYLYFCKWCFLSVNCAFIFVIYFCKWCFFISVNGAFIFVIGALIFVNSAFIFVNGAFIFEINALFLYSWCLYFSK